MLEAQQPEGTNQFLYVMAATCAGKIYTQNVEWMLLIAHKVWEKKKGCGTQR